MLSRSLGLVRRLGLTPRVVTRRVEPYIHTAPCFVVSEASADGPVGALRAILGALSAGRALVLATDMPELSVEDLRRLMSAPPAEVICFEAGTADAESRIHPFPGLYARDLAEHLTPQVRSMHQVIQAAVRVELLQGDPVRLRNINRPTDLV